jgi:hypothetical protein
MAGAGHRAWVAGEVIEANNVQQYLMDQSVQVYANAAARGSALVGFISEGMVSYLKDTDTFETFDGTTWNSVIPDLLPSSIIETPVSSKSTAYTITSGDANEFILFSAAGTATIADVLSAGQSVNFIQTGTGTITFAPGAGVTLLSKTSYRKTKAQYSAASVVSAGSGVYYLVGDLGA